jgi:hypothetical protein
MFEAGRGIMPEISDGERCALDEAGPLLRYAAEHVKDLDPDLPLAIAEARQAAATAQWSPQISQRFWNAFAKLCDQVQPVTMDSLEAAERKLPVPRWLRFFDLNPKSIAERSSRRYLMILFMLLGLILPIQLYVWTCSNLSKKIDDLVASQRTQYATLVQEFNRLDIETKTIQPDKWSTEQQAKASRIIDDASAALDAVDRINAEAYLLQRISTGARNPFPELARPTTGQWYDYYNSAADAVSKTQLQVVEIQEKANLIVGVLGAYILPILFGAIGAVAYIIRTISEQIRASTFSTSSPTRHVMRAALGAMAGLVVGLFSDLSTKFSLSPLALAFLAGYGVEALFSMFDGFIAKFK